MPPQFNKIRLLLYFESDHCATPYFPDDTGIKNKFAAIQTQINPTCYRTKRIPLQ